MQKKTYMVVIAENGDEDVYYSDRIFAIEDEYGNEGFEEIWNLDTKEELADYKKLDDFIYFVHGMVNDECDCEFDTVRVIFCDINGGFFGLSIKYNYDPDTEEFDYVIFDWRDGEHLFKFNEVSA